VVANVNLRLGEANSAPPTPLGGFEGPLRGGKGERKLRRQGKRKGRNQTEGMGEKHPRNTFLITA